MRSKEAFQKILSLVRPKVKVAGLEIAVNAVRLVVYIGGSWRFFSQKLEPGVFDGDKIKDRAKLIEALKNVRSQMLGKQKSSKKANVVASWTALPVYSQIFTLPVMSGENLNQAIELNLQMVSPEDFAQVYSGSQIMGKDSNLLNLEILGAFVNRVKTDELTLVLHEAGFVPVVLEFKALALSRLVRELGEGLDLGKSYLLLHLDQAGLDSLALRRGQLYFEYFNLWKDIFQSEEREVNVSVFEPAVVRNINQVLNFYNQHWPDDHIQQVFVVAGDLYEESAKVLSDSFSLASRPFALKLGQKVSSEWFVALGSGLRAEHLQRKDAEINFLGKEAEAEFHREHVASFLDLWRVLLPSALAILCGLFFAANTFATRTLAELRTNPYAIQPADLTEVEKLREDAGNFNRAVTLIRSVQGRREAQSPLISQVNNLALQNSISIVRLVADAPDKPVTLDGEARSVDDIKAFKDSLQVAKFKNVDLPVNDIRKTPVGSQVGYSFTITFSRISSNTE